MSNVKNQSKPNYSIVLVNYKSYQLTTICLELLEKIVHDNQVPVWVVDNDSQDESTEYLRSLDWINLIERPTVENEAGFMSHGLALDLVLDKVETDYLFLLHTDTFIHDPVIFDIMLNKLTAAEDIAAVGCVDQIYRGEIRIAWRFITRFISHYFRKLKIKLNIKSKGPKPFYEVYLKSFCALWNVKIMKSHNLRFTMNNKTPGYEAQDQLTKKGYKISYMSARRMFKHLDHVESGTVSAQGNYGKDHRRTKNYNSYMEKFK